MRTFFVALGTFFVLYGTYFAHSTTPTRTRIKTTTTTTTKLLLGPLSIARGQKETAPPTIADLILLILN